MKKAKTPNIVVFVSNARSDSLPASASLLHTDQLAETLWQTHSLQNPLTPVDAVGGLGRYELRVAHYCAELYHRDIAPLIIFTGGSGN